MSITRKPKAATNKAGAVDIEALIAKGGSSPTQQPSSAADAAKPIPVLLRMPAHMLQQIEAAVKARPIKIPRHLWILEAVLEKLTRESPQNLS